MGTKYPSGASPVWPPRDWTCPGCNKYHSKPHFAFDGQVDFTKKPSELGRVKFNREGSGTDCDSFYKDDAPTKKMKQKTGPMFDKNGVPNGLFCPHCGWTEIEDNVIVIKKVKSKGKKFFDKVKGFVPIPKKKTCHMQGCNKPAEVTNGDVGFCKKDYERITEPVAP